MKRENCPWCPTTTHGHLRLTIKANLRYDTEVKNTGRECVGEIERERGRERESQRRGGDKREILHEILGHMGGFVWVFHPPLSLSIHYRFFWLFYIISSASRKGWCSFFLV